MTDTRCRGTARSPSTDPVAYFETVSHAFERAAAAVGAREHEIVVGDAAVRLRFAGPALEALLLPALTHLRSAASSGEPALTVSVFDSASTGRPMPPPAWGNDDYGAKGEIVGFNDDRIRTVFQPGVDIFNMYDALHRRGLYWVAAPQVVPWWETTFPLRTMFHWWSASTALQPAHAGAVGRGGRGVLVVGNSGAGKSTTTLACLEAGLDFAGDDYVLVDTQTPTAHSLYGTAKLEPHNLARFPRLAPFVANAASLEVEKATLFLGELRRERLVRSLQLDAIVLPSVAGTVGSSVEPVSPSAALRVLAPTTTFHLPGYGREVLTKLGALVRRVPCYRLHAGSDLTQLAGVLAGLIGS